MRKIISKEDVGKKRRRNQLLIGGILILVMIFSTIGYSLNSGVNNPTEKIVYNGMTFTKDSGFWNAQIGNAQFSFLYNPAETENFNSPLNNIGNYTNKPLYIYSKDSAAATEIYRNLFYQNQIVQRVQDACVEGETCNSNAPVKTCNDNLIIIKEGNDSIVQSGNCVYIEGISGNLTKLSDSFLFKIIGIQ